MKRMRSKTILLNLRDVEADTYVLPNHDDYEYIDIYVHDDNTSASVYVRVYKEQHNWGLTNGFVGIYKAAIMIVELKGLDLHSVFAVGWK